MENVEIPFLSLWISKFWGGGVGGGGGCPQTPLQTP